MSQMLNLTTEIFQHSVRLHAAHELIRADLKKGREGALMPFDIACAFFETGDMALLDL
jgi:hypothetical protein